MTTMLLLSAKKENKYLFSLKAQEIAAIVTETTHILKPPGQDYAYFNRSGPHPRSSGAANTSNCNEAEIYA